MEVYSQLFEQRSLASSSVATDETPRTACGTKRQQVVLKVARRLICCAFLLGGRRVTRSSYRRYDSLSILVHNFLKSLSAIMFHVMTANVPNTAHKWVRNDICIINLLLYICGRHEWCQSYVMPRCFMRVTN